MTSRTVYVESSDMKDESISEEFDFEESSEESPKNRKRYSTKSGIDPKLSLSSSKESIVHIYNLQEKLLDEYSAWNCIQMIISDTTALNTGRKNIINVKLQKIFETILAYNET